MTIELDELEQRVTQRYFEKANAGWEIPDDVFETIEFPPGWTDQLTPVQPGERTLEISTVGQPLPPPIVQFPLLMQFPREQWLVRPARRTVILITADRMLDHWDNLTDEQRSQVAFLLSFGGRERVA